MNYKHIIAGTAAILGTGAVMYGANTRSLENQIRADLLTGNIPTLDTSSKSINGIA